MISLLRNRVPVAGCFISRCTYFGKKSTRICSEFAFRSHNKPSNSRLLSIGQRPVTLKFKKEANQHLKQFGRDLTEEAKTGRLDPVIGRDETIQRCLQVLARRTKNNPILIGEAGVGKTAIAEGLAQHIVSGQVCIAP